METNQGFTLTQAAFLGRNFVKFGVITLVVLIVGRTFLAAAIQFYKAANPPPPPPPTVGFGALPPLHFPAQTENDKPKNYQLELPTTGFPSFGDRAQVFLMTKSAPNLLADQRARSVAAQLGYTGQPTVLNERTYRWTKLTPLQSTLDLDIQNNNFSIQTNYLSRPELLSQKNLPPDAQAVTLAKSLLSGALGNASDLATSSGTITYLKSSGTGVTPAVSFSDADFLQVDIWRTPIESAYNFFSADGKTGTIHTVITGAFDGRDKLVEYQYHYQPIDYTQVQTYPLRSVASAWQVLQGGEGYIAQKGSKETAVIRSVELGYYEDPEEQDYMQPIYVFRGDEGFVGYVSAIDPRYLQTAGK
jgi:hypothetical protein